MSKKSQSKFFFRIYTTAGCEACKIMTRLVRQAAGDEYPIEIEEIGTDKVGISIQKLLHISDFPCTVFYKNTEDGGYFPTFELVGTHPVVKIRKLIIETKNKYNHDNDNSSKV